MKRYAKITLPDLCVGSYIQPLEAIHEAIQAELDGCDVGTKVQIEIIEMDEKDYGKLPEFQGLVTTRRQAMNIDLYETRRLEKEEEKPRGTFKQKVRKRPEINSSFDRTYNKHIESTYGGVSSNDMDDFGDW